MHQNIALMVVTTLTLGSNMRWISALQVNSISTSIRRRLNSSWPTSFHTTSQLLNEKKINYVSTSTAFLGGARSASKSTSALALASSSTSTTSMLGADVEVMESMRLRIQSCNQIPQHARNNLLDFVVDGKTVGKTTHAVAMCLCDNTPSSNPVFEISKDTNSDKKILSISEAVDKTLDSRTEAVMSVMKNLRSKGVITGWRDELLPLSEGFYDEPLVLVERAAAPFLGMQQYGVHINGFVKMPNGEEKMWMARRSATKSKYPNMLDHIVAGGQPAGLGLMDNVLKECMEEAGIPENIALKGIQAAGAISYEGYEDSTDSSEIDGVISRSALFCYDLELPPDFIPRAVDGEVSDFFLWDMKEVIESMKKDYKDPIKPNCYIVIIDFLLRRGYISPEIPGYLDVLRELRGGLCG